MSLDALAGLLRYPDPTTLERAAAVPPFATAIAGLSQEQLEELYTVTFDLNPVAALEVGWQLYGEQYERGRFLVKVREKLALHGLEESTELPDHLITLLPLLPRLEESDARLLAGACVLPAVEKMLACFEGKANPYEHVLRAVRDGVAAHARPAERSEASPVENVESLRRGGDPSAASLPQDHANPTTARRLTEAR